MRIQKLDLQRITLACGLAVLMALAGCGDTSTTVPEETTTKIDAEAALADALAAAKAEDKVVFVHLSAPG